MNKVKSFYFTAVIVASACVLLCPGAYAQTEPPNIVLLVADDMRWDAMGAAGNGHIQTPHLDRLAAEGTRFSNAFATTAICCTSRVSILTGMYASTHGIDDFRTPMPKELLRETYPVRLREAGYYTGFVGKWGIGGPMPADAFDVFNGFSGQGQYFNEVDGETVHMTTLLAGQAQDFLRDAPDGRPFCLSLSFKAPHVQDNDPRQFLYDPELEYLYADRRIPEPATATQAAYEAMPDFIGNSENRNRWERRFANREMSQRSLRGYYRLVSGIDRAVGEVVDTLERTGRADNTVIVFTSDHGFFLGEYGLAGKWLMHEPSIRVPFIVYDPRIPRRERADVREEMVLLIDIAPTLLALAGLDPIAAAQGRNVRPLLRPGRAAWRDMFYYEHYFGSDRPDFIPASEGVRTKRYKYIRYVSEEPPYEQLYDLQRDPYERENLIDEPDYSRIRETMTAHWRDYQRKLQPWKPSPANDEKATP